MPRFFTFAEMTATQTGLDNTPNWDAIANLEKLSVFLDGVRESFGKPIRVNCGFRTKAVNEKVGGSSTSAHLRGMAADICAWSGREGDNRELLSILERSIADIDQLISYHAVAGDSKARIRFIHVGMSPTPRGQRLYK